MELDLSEESAGGEGKQGSVMVLFFAAARERSGVNEERWLLAEAPRLDLLRAALFERYPALVPLDAYLRWAVNERFVESAAFSAGEASLSLQAGDRIALIPPVSGG